MRVSSSSSSQARRSLSRLTSASKPSRRAVSSRYSSHSASKLASMATSRRTVASSSENRPSNDRIRSIISLVPYLQGVDRMTGRSSVKCLSQQKSRFGLDLHLSNLIDDFRVGQRGDVTGILVVRNRPEHTAHDLA